MKNVIVTGLVAFALVGCGGSPAEDAGAVPVTEESVQAETVEETTPTEEVVPVADETATAIP